MSSELPFGDEANPVRVAVVGSGPSGFYAAAALLNSSDKTIHVDVFDRLPTPYGLVRGGVAPDHERIKGVTRSYEKSAAKSGFRFFGNVELGKDLSVDDLKACYHQIVYAVGNENDRRMGIPGEGTKGSTPASVFVGWYNAHPDYRQAAFDWTAKQIVIIGNGNVAVDVARILAKNHDELVRTDIAEHALAELDRAQTREIVMLGRRGPVQATFTPAELRELAELESATLCIEPGELELDAGSRAELERAGAKASAPRNVEILEAASGNRPGTGRTVRLRFRVSPKEILLDESGRTRGVRVERNELFLDDGGQTRARATGEHEEIAADWVIVAIGYQGRPIAGVPFDEAGGVIANIDGRVCETGSSEAVPNQYVVGWAKSGPRGLIGMHKSASAAVVNQMLEDIDGGSLASAAPIADDAMTRLLEDRGIRYVTFDDWKRIEAAETERGRNRGAPRVKYSRVDELLDAATND